MESVNKKRSRIWYTGLFLGIFLFAGMILFCSRSAAVRPHVFILRTAIILFFAVFYCLHFFLDIKKMYEWIYRYRWYIGIVLFIILVLNKVHFSSLAMFDDYIQPTEGSEFVRPVLGIPRPIRSDEWLVNVTRMMTGELTGYGKYNDIVRAAHTTNISASGYYLDYSALAIPSSWGYYLFGSEYGISFSWCFKMIFGFLFNYEMFLILTKDKRLLSLFGASLTWFSMFTMWWSVVNYMLSGPAIIVLFYYFTKEKVRWKRFLLGMALAFAGADYVVGLYPAWQVPLGWIIVALMIWTLTENTDWKHYQAADWMIFAVNVAFMASMIVRYMIVDQEYLTAIMNTVYPGSRTFYGGYSLNKLLNYYSSIITPFGGYPNPCEMAVMFGVFPLPLILLALVQIKEKMRNKLLWFLTVPTAVLLAYCITELPQIVAKVLMLTYSTPLRTADFLGFALAIIMIVCISELIDSGGISYTASAVICTAASVLPAWYAYTNNSGLKVYLIIAVIIASLVLETFIVSGRSSKPAQIFMAIGFAVFAITGLSINPIMVGLDAITSKPVYAEIQKIVKEDPSGRWAGLDNIVSGNYLIACGAPTINSVNYIPNMELWHKLDPKGEYDEIYNRYAHFILSLGDGEETDYNLIQADLMQITVNEKDFDLMDLDYIYCNAPVAGKWAGKMELIYEHNGSYIYKVN